MPLSFLTPLFLAGLAALAIPIWIHLTDRERRDVTAFPSLMFLQRVPHQTVRRQRIRHWLLFLLRSGAVVLLVLAFARPLLDRSGAGGAFAGGREVVILLDRSFSMGYADRWERAVSAAGRLIDEVGERDLASVVAFADRAEALAQSTADPIRLRAALDGARPQDGPTRYAPALQVAAQILSDSKLPRHEVVLISDFQRAGWNPDEAVQLPSGAWLTAIDVAEGTAPNLSVSDVSVDSRGSASAQQLLVTARVVNTGPDARRNVEVKLSVEGQQLAAQSTDLDPNSAATVHFPVVQFPRRLALATVTAGEDPLAGDNTFQFVIAPHRAVRILLLEHAAARSTETIYLRRALNIGSDPGFDVVTKPIAQLATRDLTGRPGVILNDVPYPGGAAGRRLLEYVTEGGRLLVIMGRRATPGSWNSTGGIVTGTVAEPVDRLRDRGGSFVVVAYDHPVFEPFKAPRSGNFSTARFFRYRGYTPDDSSQVLARFDDGRPALTESAVGEGRVLVLTTGLDNVWNDLSIQPVFLPFVHQVARHVSGYGAPRMWVTAGQVLDLRDQIGDPATGSEPPREVVIETPSGDRILREFTDEEGQYLQVRERGFYRIRPVDDRTAVLTTIAVNMDPAESDLTAMDPDELVGAVSAGTAEGDEVQAAVVLAPDERERRQGLWWYLVVATLLILVTESILSNRVRPLRGRPLTSERP